MRQANLSFQTNISVQMSSQMNAELAPILTQIDFLTQQVENVQPLLLPPGVENQEIFTSGSEMSETEAKTDGGYAPVKGKKKNKGDRLLRVSFTVRRC